MNAPMQLSSSNSLISLAMTSSPGAAPAKPQLGAGTLVPRRHAHRWVLLPWWGATTGEHMLVHIWCCSPPCGCRQSRSPPVPAGCWPLRSATDSWTLAKILSFRHAHALIGQYPRDVHGRAPGRLAPLAFGSSAACSATCSAFCAIVEEALEGDGALSQLLYSDIVDPRTSVLGPARPGGAFSVSPGPFKRRLTWPINCESELPMSRTTIIWFVVAVLLTLLAVNRCLQHVDAPSICADDPTAPACHRWSDGGGGYPSPIPIANWPHTDRGWRPWAHCYGLIEGLSYASRALGFCPPADATLAQMARVIIAYIEARPERMHENLPALAVEAQRRAWPCT